MAGLRPDTAVAPPPGAAPQQPQQAAQPPQAQPGPQMPAGGPAGAQEASPEEQALYNRVVAMAMMAIFDEKMIPQYLDMIQTEETPTKGIAEVSAQIAMRVYTFLQGQDMQVPGDVMLHAGMEIVENVVELVEASGQEVPEEEAERAFYFALDRFRSMAQEQGLYTEETAQQDLAQIKQMNDDGSLERMMQEVQSMQQQGGV